MSVTAAAAVGMQSAVHRLDEAARRVTQWGESDQTHVDLAQEMLAASKAKVDFQASATLARAADDITGLMLNMRV